MIAAYLEDGRVEVRDTEPPELRPGFARLRLRVAGICNTDLELQQGYYGFSGIPGHEFVADVVESPDPQLTGKRVVGEINLACGTCSWCARGLGRHCPSRSVLGIVKHPGAFAEEITLPVANLRVVPDHVSDEQAVFTEPLAAACEILDQVEIPIGAPVAVLGDGKLGLLIAQVLQQAGADVCHYGRHRSKLAISQACGIGTELIGEGAPRAAFEWVVDATGSAAGLKQAIAMTRPRGTLILKSTVHGDVPVDTAPVIVNELTLVGSRCGRFEPALELLAAGRVATEALIHDTYPLRRAPEAFARAATKGTLKVLLSSQ